MGIQSPFGYNIQLEMCNAYERFFSHKEVELNGLIDQISQANLETKTISDLMNKLAHAKKTDKKTDFSNDQEVRTWIDHIHERNPTIFEENRYRLKNEEEIDVVIQGLDAEQKMIAAEMNQHMMTITNKYEDRSQMTEQARQVLKEASDHIQSIIHKQKGG